MESTQPTIGSTAARLALGGIATFLFLLVILHFLRSDLDPSWHFISEYELGPYGWLMQGAFFALAIGNFAVLEAVRPLLTGFSGWCGWMLFGLGAVGILLGGLFVPDPMNSPPENLTLSGHLHNLGGGLGLAGFVGSLILSYKLWRHPSWSNRRTAVVLATGLLLTAFLISFVGIASIAAQSQGVFGPETPVGWPNRIGVLGGCLWILIVAAQARSRPANQ